MVAKPFMGACGAPDGAYGAYGGRSHIPGPSMGYMGPMGGPAWLIINGWVENKLKNIYIYIYIYINIIYAMYTYLYTYKPSHPDLFPIVWHPDPFPSLNCRQPDLFPTVWHPDPFPSPNCRHQDLTGLGLRGYGAIRGYGATGLREVDKFTFISFWLKNYKIYTQNGQTCQNDSKLPKWYAPVLHKPQRPHRAPYRPIFVPK